ncbi:MAG: glycosyltransferase [Bacteroidota bacterium]|nr:glycosyltransferase [Bacteroidota bacterium]MDP3145219.1 glycosyltransferase [Bacteroidota bacterium]MDP3557256.1 glycosyltransferase [Bacteroidota bacterium]
MKLLFLTSYYPPFLEKFLKQHDCSGLNFDQTLTKLLEQFFADTGSLCHYTEKAGNETFLIIANCEVLQKKWANENNFMYTDNWFYEIAFEQIKAFKPDVFYLEYVTEFFGEFAKSVSPFCKKIVSWISSPLNPNTKLNNIDLVFSSTPDFVDSFRKQGIAAEYMHPAFDPRILQEIKNPQQKTIPFSFVGGWSDVHINRKIALKKLAKNTAIQLWGYNYIKNFSKRELGYYKNILIKENPEIIKRYKGEAWGLQMYDIIQKSLITFNIHESLLKGYVGNMRMFEATGVGTMVLNDEGTNLSSLFVPGQEIETYKTIDEAIEKVNYYTANPQKAIEIGKKAQQRTLNEYNYDNYVKILFSHLNRLF